MSSGSPGIAMRAATAADEALLYRIYASTRDEELALTGWSDEMRAQFLGLQFRARQAAYAAEFAGAESWIIEVDGKAAGRLLVDRRSDAIHVVDIALLPAYRGRGVGTALLRRLIDAAGEHDTDLTLSVETTNRAAGLYRRLGLVETGVRGPHRQMRYRPARAATIEPQHNLQQLPA